MVGPKPSFSNLEVGLAFLTLGEGKSRASLTKELGVGEGAMRSILDALKQEGLIMSTNQGHAYSEKGNEILSKIRSLITGPLRVCTQFYPQSVQAAFVIKGRGELSWHARDVAIAHGAEAALVLTMKDRLMASGLDEDFSTLQQQLQLRSGDSVIVAVASDTAIASKAALASAMQVSEELSSLLAF